MPQVDAAQINTAGVVIRRLSSHIHAVFFATLCCLYDKFIN